MVNKAYVYLRVAFLSVSLSFVAMQGSAQNTEGLKTGDVPSQMILPSSRNTVDAIKFPYKNELLYLRFWAPDSLPSFSDFNRLKWLYKHNLRENFRTISGFEILFVALEHDREKWQQTLDKLKIASFSNYIALKGAEDYYLRQFRLSSLPYSLLVNEKGEIKAVNPDLSEIDQAITGYKQSTTRQAENIAGVLSQGDTAETRISHQLVYVTNQRHDTIRQVRTNADGVFVIPDIKSEENLTLNVSESDQVDGSRELHLADAEGNIIDDFNHTPIGYNITITRREINGMSYPFEVKDLFYSENLFKSGQNSLSEEAKRKLNQIAEVMSADQSLSVEILSHTDCSGNNAANLSLSVLRANLCASYIYSKGIAKSRMNTIGYGETVPLNHCVDGVSCSQEELEVNRRVEFRFYRMLPK